MAMLKTKEGGTLIASYGAASYSAKGAAVAGPFVQLGIAQPGFPLLGCKLEVDVARALATEILSLYPVCKHGTETAALELTTCTECEEEKAAGGGA